MSAKGVRPGRPPFVRRFGRFVSAERPFIVASCRALAAFLECGPPQLAFPAMDMKMTLTLLGAAMALTAVPGPAAAQAAAPVADRVTVTRADQLPRRSYTLARLPSEYLTMPLAELRSLGQQLEADIRADLKAYDIQDAATLRGLYNDLAALAQLRGDWPAVPALTARARELQDKPGPRATAGLLTELLAQQQAERRDAAWLTQAVRSRYGALNWADVQESVKGTKSQLETYNPQLAQGLVTSQFDPMAKNGGMAVPAQVLSILIGARVQAELLPPQQAAVVAGLQAVLDANAKAAAKADIWTPRTFTLPADAKAQPVAVGIWDSGVDLALFRAVPQRGLAFDADARPSPELLRPLGDAAPRWPQLRQLVQGAMDNRAQLDSAAARQFRGALTSLKADQARGFIEDMTAATLYTHGTHVAGIAVEGNPFARVFAASMLWSSSAQPQLPTEARSRAVAESYRATVDAMKKAGVRVVNMSWRDTPQFKEQALAFHSQGGTPEQRKALASRLFQIERDALQAAIASAPEMLFVAGSGNEDNSAEFEDYIDRKSVV